MIKQEGTTTLDISTQAVQRMMEIGYLAAGSGQFTEAESIFGGLQAVRPESELPIVGLAIVRMNMGRFSDSVSLLRSALEKNPNSDLAMSFLGLALRLAGYGTASDAVLQQVVKANHHPQAVALAGSLLGKEQS